MDWFTSDTHFNHKNILKHDDRPFSDIQEMNRVIIANLNAVVKPTDRLFHLGDFAWGHLNSAVQLRKRINCKRITLIYGNHDKHLRKKPEFTQLFENCYDLKDIKCGEHTIILCHYPIHSWEKQFHRSLHLHGHDHHEGDYKERRLNVATNLNGYKPLSYGDILRKVGI